MTLAEFGHRLKQLMEQRGETPQTIAAKMEITPQAVHKWMRGASEITLPNLRQLARILNVNWLWLRYGDNVVMELATPVSASDPIGMYRHRLLNDLVEAERRRRWALETLGVGVFELNVLTEEWYWGQNFRRMMHLPMDMVASTDNLHVVLTPELSKGLDEAIRTGLQTGNRRFIQGGVAVIPDVIIEIMIEPVREGGGETIRLMGIARMLQEGRLTLREFLEGMGEQ